MAYKYQPGSCSTAGSVLFNNCRTKTLPSLLPPSSTQHPGPQVQNYLLQTLRCSFHFQVPEVLQVMLPIRILLHDGCTRETIRQSIRRLVRAKINLTFQNKKNHRDSFFFFFFLLEIWNCVFWQGRKERNSPSSPPSWLLPSLLWLAGSDDQGSCFIFQIWAITATRVIWTKVQCSNMTGR